MNCRSYTLDLKARVCKQFYKNIFTGLFRVNCLENGTRFNKEDSVAQESQTNKLHKGSKPV